MKSQTISLAIERQVADAMIDAARKAAPFEACGLLGGTDSRVTAYYKLTNADASGEHYSMLPEEQFTAVKDMRAKGLRMLAIWHSHPATPARMSDEDLRLAYTRNVVYVIVSLATQGEPDIRGFAIDNTTSTEVPIVIDTNPRTPDP